MGIDLKSFLSSLAIVMLKPRAVRHANISIPYESFLYPDNNTAHFLYIKQIVFYEMIAWKG